MARWNPLTGWEPSPRAVWANYRRRAGRRRPFKESRRARDRRAARRFAKEQTA